MSGQEVGGVMAIINIQHVTEVDTSILDMEPCWMLGNVVDTDVGLLIVVSCGDTMSRKAKERH